MQTKTPDRILQTSLELFNQFGEPNVTTAQIADEMDISPGNLYYHFKGKDEIILELYQRFEKEKLELLDESVGEHLDLEDLWFEIHLTFEIIARYRFLYRNLVDLHGRLPALSKRWRILQKRKMAATRTLCTALINAELMSADTSTLDILCEQVVLTETFWINHWQVFWGNDDQSDPITRGVYQVVRLLTPHMAAEPREYLLALGEAYL